MATEEELLEAARLLLDALAKTREITSCKTIVAKYDVTAGDHTLETEIVSFGDLKAFGSAVAIADGCSPAKIRIGRAFMRNLFPGKSKKNPAAGERVFYPSPMILGGGDYLYAEFTDVPEGCDLYLYTACSDRPPAPPGIIPTSIIEEEEEVITNMLLAGHVSGGGGAYTCYLGIGHAYESYWEEPQGTFAIIMPAAGTLKNLRIYTSTVGYLTETATATVYKNGVASAITCFVDNSTQTASDTTNTLAVAAGDRIEIEVVVTPAGQIDEVSYSLQLELS